MEWKNKNMRTDNTALLLIGLQNDYFAADGILSAVIAESAKTNNVLANILALLDRVEDRNLLVIHTPIVFTEDYSELVEPVGILRAIKEAQAFKAGTRGCETIDEIRERGDQILEIPGKRGLNAFSNTELEQTLHEHGIQNLVIAGAVTSICVDSTGRSAFETGFKVKILSDCTCGRTDIEQTFFCDEIFPLYAEVLRSGQMLERLEA